MPLCQATCPLHVDMKGANALIREHKFNEALMLIRERLPFPGIMGRVCTHPCEEMCKRKEVDEPIAIKHLKRSAFDYGMGDNWDLTVAEEKEERIAIVGGGPAGLMAAYELRKMGYQVTIFEALPVLGGMLAVGIPDYRLPRDILSTEVEAVQRLGVETKLNTPIGKDLTIDDLWNQGYRAIFIAVGAHKSEKLNVPGEDSEGVVHGTDFLRELNLGKEVKVKEKVAIIGGGNVAIDAARSVIRLGAKDVFVLYRRSREEMPASDEEIEAAQEEGIEIQYLVAPIEILSESGKVTGIKCIRMELGEPDGTGRRRPIPVDGSEFSVDAEMVIPAIGQAPDFIFLSNGKFRIGRGGTFEVDSVTLETNVPGVFAGGDAVSGPATVIEALAAGKKAAISIDRYIKGEDITIGREGEGPQESNLYVNLEGVGKKKRVGMSVLPPGQRKQGFKEVELGFSKEEAVEEAERCLSCECQVCLDVCSVYRVTQNEEESPFNRIKAARQISQGEEITPQMIESIYDCSQCYHCTHACPNEIDLVQIVAQARLELMRKGLAPLERVERHNEVIERMRKGGKPSDRMDPAKRLDWLPEKFVPRESSTLFFVGCLASYAVQGVAVSSYLLLKKLGVDFMILEDEGCCGVLLYFEGRLDLAREKFEENADRFKRLGIKRVITACPGCYFAFKPLSIKLLGGIDYEVIHINELLLSLLKERGIKMEQKGIEVTFHDSCHIGLYDESREVLRRCGVTLNELPWNREKSLCCGTIAGGGEMNLKLSASIVDSAPVSPIVTSCPACVLGPSRAIQMAGSDKKVKSVSEIVFQALSQSKL
jgi:NADPH-dependent glutamate synthase beta subunit-like oxidoreductase